ncbi:MAG TPA: biotin transporter BioY [Rectinema sp.]|nr:biotin transporter BioY [Rectinema sp.]HPG96424.1 biotin transporter BioY [Rectinema sp.]HQL16900.1 biotin transporter BioY [Rectinema sp.]
MEGINAKLTQAIMACLFAALISVGAYAAFPIPGTPVPIVLQNMFIMLAGFILGPWWGLVSVIFYLILGSVGLPVFSGGTGGLAKFAGPTGGYLIGYIPAVIVFGLISKLGKGKWIFNLLAGITGMIIVYAVGIAWLKSVLEIGWGKAIATGLIPFLLGDIVKIILASVLTPPILKVMSHIDQQTNG